MKSSTKTAIIEQLNTERRRLLQNLEHLTPEQMTQPGVVGVWSIKDILAHLADWEAHMPIWVASARQGDPVAEIESGLNWKQFEDFNVRIYARHKDQSLSEVLTYFHSTHQSFMDMVEAMPEDEMLTYGQYRFIGKGAVIGWLNAYANHDAWAKKYIRQWLKTRGK